MFSRYRGFVNAPNKVPEHQRTYQAAYRGHTRIWRIVSMLPPVPDRRRGRPSGGSAVCRPLRRLKRRIV